MLYVSSLSAPWLLLPAASLPLPSPSGAVFQSCWSLAASFLDNAPSATISSTVYWPARSLTPFYSDGRAAFSFCATVFQSSFCGIDSTLVEFQWVENFKEPGPVSSNVKGWTTLLLPTAWTILGLRTDMAALEKVCHAKRRNLCSSNWVLLTQLGWSAFLFYHFLHGGNVGPQLSSITMHLHGFGYWGVAFYFSVIEI